MNDFVPRSFQILLLGGLIGLAAGVGGYTFYYAKGASYLTDRPETCANCHIMSDHYNGWIKSSHRSVAVCNDCHTPAGLIPKYVTKAKNGFWHSLAFTSGQFPDPVRIKPRNVEVVESACRKCHEDIVDTINGPHQDSAKISCIRCHRSVGHLD